LNISIILLAQHFNLTVQCLDRIKKYTSMSYELIVVSDNESAEVSN